MGGIEAAGQAIDFRESVAGGRHRLGPLGLHLDNIVGSILDVGEQEAAARIAFAYLGERFDRLRVDIVHDALGARARRVGIGAERRESRSEEHTSELQSLMRISYAVFCLNKKKNNQANMCM